MATLALQHCNQDEWETCDGRLSGVANTICAANLLLAVIEDPREHLIGTEAAQLTVGPQDAESNLELANEVIRLAGEALDRAYIALMLHRTGCDAVAHLAVSDPSDSSSAPRTIGAALAAYYLESVEIAGTAAEHVARAGTAVSDQQLSLTDRARAAHLRLAPFASRVAAAHALVGGDHSLPALGEIGTDGVFSRPPLSRRGQTALAILRRSGIRPAVLADESIDATELIAGGTDLPETSYATKADPILSGPDFRAFS